jgi:hypothetical protein
MALLNLFMRWQRLALTPINHFIRWSINFVFLQKHPSYQNLVTKQPIWVRVMVFNAIFNNISVISWRSVLLVEETRMPRLNLVGKKYQRCSFGTKAYLLLQKTILRTPTRHQFDDINWWVIVVLHLVSNISAISWRGQVIFRCYHDGARFVLDQHA